MPKKAVEEKEDEVFELVDDSDNDSGEDEEAEDEEEYLDIPEDPIHPGLYIKSEYLLLALIGKGNNATVWLAYNSKDRKYYAVKIQQGDFFDDGRREVKIIREINKYANAYPKKDIHCVKMLDCFTYVERDETGEKIKYVCSVYDLYACSLNILLTAGKYKYGFPIPVAKEIIRQLLIGLEVLHEKLKIVQTDIKPHNILIEGINPETQNMIDHFDAESFHKTIESLKKTVEPEDLDEQIELYCLEVVRPVTEAVIAYRDKYPRPDIDGDQVETSTEDVSDGEEFELNDDDDEDESSDDGLETVLPMGTRRQSVDDIPEDLEDDTIHDLDNGEYYAFVERLNRLPEDSSDGTRQVIPDEFVDPRKLRIAITDFGNSRFLDRRTNDEIQDRRYRDPSVILNLGYNSKCDIWSVGCIAYELITGFVLFEALDEPGNFDLHHLFLIEKMLGEIPEKMKKNSKRRPYLFDASRGLHIRAVKEFQRTTIHQRLMDQFKMSEIDAIQAEEFIEECLTINPNKRPRASRLLKHPWLQTSDS